MSLLPLQISCTREQLPDLYQDLLKQNPLLERTQTQLRLIGWTPEEVRTMQLLLACASNASLLKRVRELEAARPTSLAIEGHENGRRKLLQGP